MNEEKIPSVLIVDDDRSLRSLLKLAIESKGYKVEEAANGKECLSKYDRCQPDLVLLDAIMPEMDGFTCCQNLRSLNEHGEIPILMLTFLDDLDSIDRAFQAGATDYLTKPIHWPILFQRVRRLLAGARALTQTNELAARLQQQQAWESLLREILQHLARNEALRLILPTILAKVREFLQVEGIVFYQKSDRTVFESAVPTHPAIERDSLQKPCLETQYALLSERHQIIAIDDIDSARLPSDTLSLFRQSKIQAMLVAPLISEQKLWGLLCARECHFPRVWKPLEIERFSDLANLFSLTIANKITSFPQ